MAECATGSQVVGLFGIFSLILVIHAVPLAYLFVRWGQRYYWGLFPAISIALGLVTALDFDSSCSIIQAEFLSVFLAAAFFSVGYLSLVFFKPDLRSLGARGEALIAFILAWPLIGAVFAVAWPLMSLGRERLLMETGREVTLKDRLTGTSLHGVVIILLGAYASCSTTG